VFTKTKNVFSGLFSNEAPTQAKQHPTGAVKEPELPKTGPPNTFDSLF